MRSHVIELVIILNCKYVNFHKVFCVMRAWNVIGIPLLKESDEVLK